ncbi:DUF1336 domain containing protein [Nitzschia inconspicua]|uniref:DUF1336 domain containing protein n=1 Tax=Nitzschia inconspicua TaxID=303405 RepID=A0A9K3LR69_9STRA|nr:DUF1336 domain containing protein [Nitzschia inconspicua]
MTDRRSSVSLRKTANAFMSFTNAVHSRARSEERSSCHGFDDLAVVSNRHTSNEEETLAGLEDDNEELPHRNRLESESSLCKQFHVFGMQRANSDPFLNAGKEDEEEVGIEIGLPIPSNPRRHARARMLTEEENALPTLNRYPFAETKNRNCWSCPPHDVFMIRGPNYLNDKKKISCRQFLLQGRGCDLFLSDHPEKVDMAKLKGALGGNFRKKPSFLVRFIFPWGLLVLYFEVPEKFRPYLKLHGGSQQPDVVVNAMDGFSSAERTLAKWFAGDTEYKNDRLKLIAFVPDGPWIVRNMVTGRPAIIGKKLPVSYKYVPKEVNRDEFLVCDLDIGSSKPAAKRIVSVCRRYMSSLTVDIGFVVEAQCEEDLPEEMFGALRIHQADPIRSPTV